jgi:pimeloyl-ACP methyl ester carboxylesterase
MSRFRSVMITLLAVIGGYLGLAYHSDIDQRTAERLYATAHSKFIIVGGMRVHYQDVGAGPAIILLHGSNSSLHTWAGWVEKLKDSHRVITVDLPGHGLTGPNPADDYGYRSYGTFLAQFTKALQLDRFAIAGNSMGGAVALAYAATYPRNVDKLILINSVGYSDQQPPLVLRSWGFPVVGSVMETFTPRFVYAYSLKSLYGTPERMTDAVIDRYFNLLLRSGNRRATRERFSEPPQSWFIHKFPDLKMPALVMWGEVDPWFDVEFGYRFARDLPNGKLVTYKNLGHLPMEEAPSLTARDAVAFLKAGSL